MPQLQATVHSPVAKKLSWHIFSNTVDSYIACEVLYEYKIFQGTLFCQSYFNPSLARMQGHHDWTLTIPGSQNSDRVM